MLAQTSICISFYNNRLAVIIAFCITGLMVWSGIAPIDRAVWWAEIIPVTVIFIALIVTYPFFRFSNLAYLLMSLWIAVHTIGSHYSFANVPFEWGNWFLEPLFGEGRNHYDRMSHYLIGLFSFAMAEWLLRRRICTLIPAFFFSLFFIMSVAAAYEILEWQYAVIDGGNVGIEFLGSQGDVWDAQKDMFADTLGALTGLVIFLFARPDKVVTL